MPALPACGDLGLSKPSRRGSAGAAAAVAVEPSPKVEITAPARASFLVPGPVAIEGRVTAARDPIASVLLMGRPVTVSASGEFRALGTLGEGLNVIDASVRDTAGKTGRAAIGVLAGSYAPISRPIAAASAARVQAPALDAIGKIVEGALWALDFSTILHDDVGTFTATSFLFVRLEATVTRLRYRGLHVGITPTAQGLFVRADVDGLVLDTDVLVDFGIGGSRSTAILEADSGVATGTLALVPRPDGKVDALISNPAISFQNFRATATGGLLGTLVPYLQSLVESGVRDGLVKLLRQDAPPHLTQAINDALAPPTFDVFGKPFAPAILAEQVAFDAQGTTVRVGFQGVTGPLTPRGQAAPGSLATAGALPSLATAHGFKAALDDDALNRALYMAWAGGVIDLDLDESFLSRYNVSLPLRLEVSAIRRFLPELAGALPDATPVMIRVRPDLPPVVRITGTPDLLELGVGELGIELLVDRGLGWERLVKTVCQARVGLGLDFSTNGLRVSSVATPELTTSVVDEPLLELDDRHIEVLLGLVVQGVMPHFLNSVPVVAIPQFNQLTSLNVSIAPDPQAREHIVIEGDLVR
jgi:hypothetical protein